MAEGPRKPFALRDLEWVIHSPFLLQDIPAPNLSDHPETEALLAALRTDPEPLLTHLAGTPRLNLGRYFEQLVIFWLENLPSVNLIGSNIPIFRKKQSLGEIDLVFLHEGRAWHWELSVKFYLNIGSPAEEADFVGPMQKDTLKRKLDRLYDHQILLPSYQETRAVLRSRGIEEIASHPWVKGCLFYPAGDISPRKPGRILDKSLSGIWHPADRLTHSSLPAFDHFLILEKKRWITPSFYPEEATTGDLPVLLQSLDQAFKTRRIPYLVHLFQDDGAEMLTSLGQIFVTPESWPTIRKNAQPS
jgi:hypothetical protein